jgi:putative endonuclease
VASRVANYYVYILSSYTGTLYIGISNDLDRRTLEHQMGTIPGFTQRYRVTLLVYFERFDSARAAIAREKQLKGWRRERKLQLIRTVNPKLEDLSAGWIDKQ